jgi:hypothetical protein
MEDIAFIMEDKKRAILKWYHNPRETEGNEKDTAVLASS